jgi:hypothetical protein
MVGLIGYWIMLILSAVYLALMDNSFLYGSSFRDNVFIFLIHSGISLVLSFILAVQFKKMKAEGNNLIG